MSRDVIYNLRDDTCLVICDVHGNLLLSIECTGMGLDTLPDTKWYLVMTREGAVLENANLADDGGPAECFNLFVPPPPKEPKLRALLTELFEKFTTPQKPKESSDA